MGKRCVSGKELHNSVDDIRSHCWRIRWTLYREVSKVARGGEHDRVEREAANAYTEWFPTFFAENLV